MTTELIRSALSLGREAVVESFEHADNPDDKYLAEARLRQIDEAIAKSDDQFDARFHPWPGWPNNTPWCTRCTFKPVDDYERLAERLVERMHLYASSVKTEPHQIGEGYNNLVRMAAHALRTVGRKGVRFALSTEHGT